MIENSKLTEKETQLKEFSPTPSKLEIEKAHYCKRGHIEAGPVVEVINKDENIPESTELFDDKVNHPFHYTQHPSGIECIEITRHYNFSIGNAIKYCWRAGLKSEEGYDDTQKEIEDLEKAIWYINDRIKELRFRSNGFHA